MSAFYRFGKEVRVALDLESPIRDRRWAVWRCSYCISVLSKAAHTKVYDELAAKVGFSSKRDPEEYEMPTNKQILDTIGILIHVRFLLLEKLRQYELERSKKKRSGHRFPVHQFEQEFFTIERIRNL